MSVGGVISAVAMYLLGSHSSRRMGLWIACGLAIVAVSVQIGSTTLAALYTGRLILGLSNGLFAPYSILYIVEISPSHLRASISGGVMWQISIGALMGILVDYKTNHYTGRLAYQIPLAVMYIVPVLLAIVLVFLPDSPRYYISEGKDEAAAVAIRKTRGISDENRIRAELHDIRTAWQQEQQLSQGVRAREMFRGADLRRTMINFGANTAHTASGINFVSAFSVYLYLMIGVANPFVTAMIQLAVMFVGCVFSFPAMRFLNRRPLLIICTIISAVFMFALAITYDKGPTRSNATKNGVVALSILYTFSYGVGQGPSLWAIAGEIPSQRLRTNTAGMGAGIQFFFAWLCQFFTPYFINPDQLNWGAKYGYIWGGSNIVLALWVYFFVPETKGRTLEQLDELFEKRVPTLGFAAYVTERAAVDADKELAQEIGKHLVGETEHIENQGKS